MCRILRVDDFQNSDKLVFKEDVRLQVSYGSWHYEKQIPMQEQFYHEDFHKRTKLSNYKYKTIFK